MVGIISNSAALFAQRNLDAAATQGELSIARLSSGQAIIRASDDVSGLAIGTVLATTVSTLKTVLTSTSQAGSLLSIADAGLQGISDILQRQKSLATQANTGTLGDNERAFLNQEFTNLTSEIDRIVANTTFNGINLLDGGISGNASVTTNKTALGTGDYSTIGTFSTAGATDVTAINNFATAADPLLQGKIDNLYASFGASDVTYTTTINGNTYTSAPILGTDLAATSASTLTFKDVDGTAVFDIVIAATSTSVTNQTTANTSATEILASIADVKIVQTRDINSIDTTKVVGSVLDGFTGGADSVQLKTYRHNTTDNTFGDIESFVGVAGSGTANSLSVIINGITFSLTDFGGDDTLDATDTAVTLTAKDAVGNATGETLLINFAGMSGSVNLTNQDEVNALTTALDQLFGVGATGSGGLSFQTGTTVTDKINLTLKSAGTAEIYKTDAGTAVTLSVDTAANAQTASDVLDNAINSITSRRATIGALQSRFDFAAANITASIQNTEAARSDFLDVDIAAESTEFATSQVRLQASISVLAQANQIPQNLLKLIG